MPTDSTETLVSTTVEWIVVVMVEEGIPSL